MNSMPRIQFSLGVIFATTTVVAVVLFVARLDYSTQVLLHASMNPVALVCLPAMLVGFSWWRNHRDRRFAGMVLFLCTALFWAHFTLDRAADLVEASKY
jgi:Na+/proline symporter